MDECPVPRRAPFHNTIMTQNLPIASKISIWCIIKRLLYLHIKTLTYLHFYLYNPRVKSYVLDISVCFEAITIHFNCEDLMKNQLFSQFYWHHTGFLILYRSCRGHLRCRNVAICLFKHIMGGPNVIIFVKPSEKINKTIYKHLSIA